MARRISKTSNPKLGIYTIRFRDAKGRYTKTLSKAVSFQYVLKSGNLSRKLPIPSEIKKVSDKTIYVKKVLTKIHQAYNSRIQKAAERKKAEARRKGQKYTAPEVIPSEEAVGLSPKEREQIEQSGVKLERPDYYYRINLPALRERKKRVSKALRELATGDVTNIITLPPIIASTEGSATPTDKEGKYFKKKKTGKEINWYEHQKDIGLITKDSTDASIMLNVIRNLKKFFLEDFDKYKKEFRKFPRRKNLVIKVAAYTDIEEHDDFLDGGDELSFDVDIRLGKRALADKVSFNAAVKILQLINKDFKDTDIDKGGLTSNEILTKIRLPTEEDNHNKVKEFILFPIIYTELTTGSRNVR